MNTGTEEVSLLELSEMARTLGYKTSCLEAGYEVAMRKVLLPCIAHVRMSHYVVVYKWDDESVSVLDPADGDVKLTREQFLKIWLTGSGGVLLTLIPPKNFRDKEGRVSVGFRSIANYFWSQRRSVIFLFVIMGLLAALQWTVPFLTKTLVDGGINGNNLSLIKLVVIGQVALMLSRTVLSFARQWLLLKLSAKVAVMFMSDFFVKLLKLPIAFFERSKVGETLQRVHDYARVERFIGSSVVGISFSIVSLAVYSAILASYDLRVFWIFLILSLAYFGYMLVFVRYRRKIDLSQFMNLSNSDTLLVESISGIRDIKLYGSYSSRLESWVESQKITYNLRSALTRLQQFQEGGSIVINEGRNVLITLLVATSVMEGNMTFGTMVAVQFIIGQLQAPVSEILNFSREWQEASISLQRIDEIRRESNEQTGRSAVQMRQSSIYFKDVSFGYSSGSGFRVVLHGINMLIPIGKQTAIVGESGSGKSTLVKLITKMCDPNSGSIFIGEQFLSDLDTELWRSVCGVVLQDGYIFADTVRNNITMGRPFDEDSFSAALTASQLDKVVQYLPGGIETMVGPEGTGLSQGQRQRILIARALYGNPLYILFDEATSALDSITEQRVMNEISLFRRRSVTTVVVTHRLSSVRHSDNIIVLHEGRIVEQGKHDQLIAHEGYYFRLVESQLPESTVQC